MARSQPSEGVRRSDFDSGQFWDSFLNSENFGLINQLTLMTADHQISTNFKSAVLSRQTELGAHFWIVDRLGALFFIFKLSSLLQYV